MGVCDEFISEEELAQIKLDWGPGLCEKEVLRIRDKIVNENHLDFVRVPDFDVRSQNLKWLIY